MKCECPEEADGAAPASWYEPQELKARIHEPNECPGDYELKKYIRDGKSIILCSACNLSGDKEMSEEGATVRVKIELDLIEGKNFNLPIEAYNNGKPEDHPEHHKFLLESATEAFIYWLDSWAKKEKIDFNISEYIQAKVIYD